MVDKRARKRRKRIEEYSESERIEKVQGARRARKFRYSTLIIFSQSLKGKIGAVMTSSGDPKAGHVIPLDQLPITVNRVSLRVRYKLSKRGHHLLGMDLDLVGELIVLRVGHNNSNRGGFWDRTRQGGRRGGSWRRHMVERRIRRVKVLGLVK